MISEKKRCQWNVKFKNLGCFHTVRPSKILPRCHKENLELESTPEFIFENLEELVRLKTAPGSRKKSTKITLKCFCFFLLGHFLGGNMKTKRPVSLGWCMLVGFTVGYYILYNILKYVVPRDMRNDQTARKRQ